MLRPFLVFLIAALLSCSTNIKASTLQEEPLSNQDLFEILNLITHKLVFTFDSPFYAKCTVTQNEDGKDTVEDFLVEGPLKKVKFFYVWKSGEGLDKQHRFWLEATTGQMISKTWDIHDPSGPGGFLHTFALSLDGKQPIGLNVEHVLFSYSAQDNAGKNEKHLLVKVIFSATPFK